MSHIIQLSTHKYNAISDVDDEDVTPIDGSIAVKTQRSFKALAVGFGCCLLLTALFIFVLRYDFFYGRNIVIIQTSVLRNDFMISIGKTEMKTRGFNVGNLIFGNAECSTFDQKEGNCSPPSFKASRIVVNSDVVHQKIIGFGGAFTEATAYNFYKLPAKIQEIFIDHYFGKNGLCYSLGRVSINSCDFSLKSYSFDDVKDDYSLKYFDTDAIHDNKQILPLIRLAIKASKKTIKLLASPWSPPAWMKREQNNEQSMLGSAGPSGLIDSHKVKDSWANYFVKFITAYKNSGVPIWAITPQNEPEFAAPWEACSYNSTYENDFIQAHLGPILKSTYPDILILGFDHNKDHLADWTEAMLGNNSEHQPNPYVSGMAFHWYAGTGDRLMDGTYGYEGVRQAHRIAPDKVLLASEACSCSGVKLGNLLRAERLGHDIMYDLHNFANGYIEWNLLLDSEGGPNHLGNNCDAGIVTTKDHSDIIIQPSYYYIGHFSKYITENSRRVHSYVIGSYNFDMSIDPNVRAGFELAVHRCEQSVRQLWRFHRLKQSSAPAAASARSKAVPSLLTGYIELAVAAKEQEDITFNDTANRVRLCVARGDSNRPYLRLAICAIQDADNMMFSYDSITGQLVDTKDRLCVTMSEDLQDGALLMLRTCTGLNGRVAKGTVFRYNEHTMELTVTWPSTKQEGQSPSLFADDTKEEKEQFCVTAGWPFLSAIAFTDPSAVKKTVLVVINEADSGTHIVLKDMKSMQELWFGINAHSIQTLLY